MAQMRATHDKCSIQKQVQNQGQQEIIVQIDGLKATESGRVRDMPSLWTKSITMDMALLLPNEITVGCDVAYCPQSR